MINIINKIKIECNKYYIIKNISSTLQGQKSVFSPHAEKSTFSKIALNHVLRQYTDSTRRELSGTGLKIF